MILLVSVLCLALPAPNAAQSAGANIDVERLADGVYAVIRKEPPGLTVDANNLFIVGDEDVVVVDANISPASTREVIAALRRITDKPVRYVINTHGHDDHTIGDAVYREMYPGVEFIAHANTRDYLLNKAEGNRKSMVAGIPGVVSMIKDSVAKNKNLRGEELSDEERASLMADVRWAERYLADAPEFQIVAPTVVVEDELTLYRGGHTIEIRHLGSSHTNGDLVVYLPKEGIAATGDLVIWPVPLVGSDQSYVREWSATLERLVQLHPSIIVPGHGPVMRDDSYPKLMAELFASITKQTEAAIARGETLDQARKSVDLSGIRTRMCGDDKVRQTLFSFYVVGPAIANVYEQVKSSQ